jgi:hypothetical protein
LTHLFVVKPGVCPPCEVWYTTRNVRNLVGHDCDGDTSMFRSTMRFEDRPRLVVDRRTPYNASPMSCTVRDCAVLPAAVCRSRRRANLGRSSSCRILQP